MLSASWEAVRDASPPLVLALMAYITYWLRSHVGKSNGHGPLNKQTEDLHKKIFRLEEKLKIKEDESNDESDDSEGC